MPTNYSLAAVVAPLLVTICVDTAAAQTDARAADPALIRIGLRARAGSPDRLTPLRYLGGFETKTLIYETLVRRGPDGRLEPSLASWTISEDGTSFRFRLRPGARFQDGSLVTAEAVKTHFRRWVGLPEHDWLLANHHIEDVTVESADTFVVRLDRPYPLLGDLAAINPCAIVAPAARDWEGEFQRPLGSGPFRFVGATEDGRWRLQREEPGAPLVEICPFPRSNLDPSGNDAPLDALAAGTIDGFVSGWDEDLPSQRLRAFAQDPRFVVQSSPGSSVVYLSFRMVDGPTAQVEVRRRIAHAIDRRALIEELEDGRAEACTAWAAPSILFWPRRRLPAPAPAADPGVERMALRIAAARLNSRAMRVARAVAAQLKRHGFDIEVVELDARAEAEASMQAGGTVQPLTLESGPVRAAASREVRRLAETADLCIEITHGVPYDPQLSLVSRWGGLDNHNEDEPRPELGDDAELRDLVAQTLTIPDEVQCLPIYAQIQARLDQEALMVPLYSPHHIALRSVSIDGIELGPDIYRVDLTKLHRVQHAR
jgi:ABC-type transport system substrate-binding protein